MPWRSGWLCPSLRPAPRRAAWRWPWPPRWRRPHPEGWRLKYWNNWNNIETTLKLYEIMYDILKWWSLALFSYIFAGYWIENHWTCFKQKSWKVWQLETEDQYRQICPISMQKLRIAKKTIHATRCPLPQERPTGPAFWVELPTTSCRWQFVKQTIKSPSTWIESTSTWRLVPTESKSFLS